jgi:serine/threonine protein phosphatase PrpC
MESAIQTHIGRVRQTNEDSGRIQRYENGWILAVVADGMGGHQAGDVASQMAVDIICESLKEVNDYTTPSEMQQRLNDAIQLANERILTYAEEHTECRGMGTTVVIALMNQQLGVLAHIGDSRIYRYSQGILQQITSDHTLVNELLRNHQITQDEADNHPRRNILTRALGTEKKVKADFSVLHWETGDILLLCSDGLSGKVSSEMMAAVLANGSLKEMADELIASALQAGGEDNITVILLRNQSETEG